MSRSLSILCPHCRRKLRISDPKLLGKKVMCPGCSQSFVMKVVEPTAKTRIDLDRRRAAETDDFDQVGAARSVRDADQPPAEGREAAVSHGPDATPAAAFPFIAADTSSAGRRELDRIKSAQKRRTRQTMLATLAMVLLTAGIAGGLVYVSQPSATRSPKAALTEDAPPEIPKSRGENAYSAAALRANPALIEQFQPTQGEPGIPARPTTAGRDENGRSN